jgi:anti-sigma B factor antagonist
MEIRSQSADDAIVVVLEGELDGKTAPAAQQQIVALIPDQGRIVLDMHQVGYMSSAGLRMMLLLYRQALAKGTKIALAGLSEDIRDTMSATGFLDFFVVSDTVDEGLALLREAS